jgi:Fe-S-cluster containining protein
MADNAESFEDRFAQSFDLPHRSPILPTELGLDDTIQFDCHKGIACFNACCKNIDIMLTPYDLLRLKRRLGLTSRQLIARHTVPYEMDAHGMPGLKMLTKEGSHECQFLTTEGCGVYEDRPAACRYYALGAMGVRKKDSPTVDDVYFVVKEDHCLGHNEPRRLTVREYRHEQGVEVYDDMNRDWRDVVLKKRSSGPTVGRPTERSFDLFWLASYDIEGFRAFVMGEGFQDTFAMDDEMRRRLETSDEELMQFAFRFLKQVLFGEVTLEKRKGADERRIARRKERTQQEQGAYDPAFDLPDEG